MDAEQAQRTEAGSDFSWLSFGLGCALGLVVAAACLGTLALTGLATFATWETVREGVQENLAPATAELTVLGDGCTVRRSEVEGPGTIRNLTWVVVEPSGERVLGRAADDEYEYTYYRSGTYQVHLEAWHGGGYVPISNTVTIRCP